MTEQVIEDSPSRVDLGALPKGRGEGAEDLGPLLWGSHCAFSFWVLSHSTRERCSGLTAWGWRSIASSRRAMTSPRVVPGGAMRRREESLASNMLVLHRDRDDVALRH